MNLCSKSIDFYDMNVEVEDLTNRLNSLINSKLLKLSITLKIRKD